MTSTPDAVTQASEWPELIVPVTDQDCAVAADLCDPRTAAIILRRERDDRQLVQAFARHRIQALTAGSADWVLVPREPSKIAAAIRAEGEGAGV